MAYGMVGQRDDARNMLVTFLGYNGRLGVFSRSQWPSGSTLRLFGGFIAPKRFWRQLA